VAIEGLDEPMLTDLFNKSEAYAWGTKKYKTKAKLSTAEVIIFIIVLMVIDLL
jgi:hypothetical protein